MRDVDLFSTRLKSGWSGGAMVLGKLPVPGHPTILITVGQGPISLAVSAGGVVRTFLLSSILSPLSPCLWDTVRHRLKYCLKGPLNPKQPATNSTEIQCILNLHVFACFAVRSCA